MKKSEIVVGGHYLARVSGKLVTVRVDRIYTVVGSGRGKIKEETYEVTNLATARKLTFLSAAKFRHLSGQKTLAGHQQLTGGEQVAAMPCDSRDDKPRTHAQAMAETLAGKRPDFIGRRGGESLPTATPVATPATATAPTGQGSAVAKRVRSAGGLGKVTEKKSTSSPNASLKLSLSTEPVDGNGVTSNNGATSGHIPVKSPRIDSAEPVAVGSNNPPERGRIDVGGLGEAVLLPLASRTVLPGTPGARSGGIAAEAIARHSQPGKPAHQPTQEQQDILNAAVKLGAGDVMVIEAGAGAGKTSSLAMLEGVLKGQGQYTAFNTSLVKDSAGKFKKVSCNTTHSLAFRAVGKNYAHRLGGQRIKAFEVAKMLGIEPFEITVNEASRFLNEGLLAGQVLGAIKKFCQSADKVIDVGHFKYLDGIDMPDKDGRRTYANNELVREYLLPFAQKAWADISNPEGTLPFAHDFYVKIWQLDKPIISADYILLDECQDTAAVMLDVLKQQKALLILVGDSCQAIYEWRGAINAMDAFPDAGRQYLTQSFRFGQEIADVANSILSKIGAPLRLKGLPSIPSRVEGCPNPTAILCRTNAVAVGKLLLSINDGRKPFLVGGGTDVISFVEGARALQQGNSTGHPDLACFETWAEVEEYSKLDEGEDLQLLVKLINSFGCETILFALRGMPAERDADVVICTSHKSKGREWHSVKLAHDFPTLSKCTEADLKLIYVAATRAKLVLDVTECPFFTGQDALEIIPSCRSSEGVLPATPAVPVRNRDGYSWAKSRSGDWLVRGPKGQNNCEVVVTRRDGSSSTVTLTSVEKEFDDAALYNYIREPRPSSSRSAYRRGECYECGAKGPVGEDCTECAGEGSYT